MPFAKLVQDIYTARAINAALRTSGKRSEEEPSYSAGGDEWLNTLKSRAVRDGPPGLTITFVQPVPLTKVCSSDRLSVRFEGLNATIFNITMLKDLVVVRRDYFIESNGASVYDWVSPPLGGSGQADGGMLINVVVSGPSNDGTTFVACASAEFFELAANGDDAVHSFAETFSSPSTAFFTGPNWSTVSGQQDPSSPSNFNNTVAVASSTTENENITDGRC